MGATPPPSQGLGIGRRSLLVGGAATAMLALAKPGAALADTTINTNSKSGWDNGWFYSYWTDAKGPTENWYDLSVSQYGVLGMWACEHSGAEVMRVYWELVDTAWSARHPSSSCCAPTAGSEAS